VTTKTCRKCGLTLPLDDFVTARERPDKRGARCKPCRREDVNEWARRARERRLAEAATVDNRRSFAARNRTRTVATDSDWRDRAACRGEDPELFFPIGTKGAALLQIGEAKAVCRRCPSREACLDWAMESGQDAGVWGGLSEDERRKVKRRATRQRARVSA